MLMDINGAGHELCGARPGANVEQDHGPVVGTEH